VLVNQIGKKEVWDSRSKRKLDVHLVPTDGGQGKEVLRLRQVQRKKGVPDKSTEKRTLGQKRTRQDSKTVRGGYGEK